MMILNSLKFILLYPFSCKIGTFKDNLYKKQWSEINLVYVEYVLFIVYKYCLHEYTLKQEKSSICPPLTQQQKMQM